MERYGAAIRVVLFALVSACALFAQRDLATLVGTVTDASGAVVGSAQVTVTETETGMVYSLTTNSAGEFVRPALKPSTYELSVSAPGFKKAEQKNILLRAGERTAVNVSLTIGDIGQTVEVTAAAPLLQTESTQVGVGLNSRTLMDTPLGGQRVFSFLARLSTGVVPGEPNSRDGAGGGFSANGVRSNGQNNFLLNGVDNNVNVIDFMNQTAYTIGPSVEAISEMMIETNGYNAEYGRAAGGVINVILKSGTNQLHGSLFEILQNRDLNANSWANNRVNKPRGPFKQNQFGATAGGPILKNRLFIFGDYQGTLTSASAGLQGLGFSGLTTVPTAAMKTGDFSSILGAGATGTDSNGNPISFQKGAIYDPLSTIGPATAPLSRTVFPGNIIPPIRMDPVMAKIIQLFPSPNQPILTGTQPTNDYFYNTAGSAGTHQGDARVDFWLSSKDNLFGSVSWSDTNKTQVPPLPGALDNTGQTGSTEYDLSRNGQIGYTRVWSPRLLTETRVSFSRLVTFRAEPEAAIDDFKAFGIGGYNPTYTYANNGGLPKFSPGGYTSFGSGNWTPCKEYSNVWDIVQNVAISKGTHSLKMGAEFRSIKFPFFQVSAPHGQINYSASQTAFPSNKLSSLGTTVGGSTGDGMASALLGIVNNASLSTTHDIADQKVAWAGYVQDDWRLSSKLTINLGVRYELWSPIGERHGHQANFDLHNLTLWIPSGKDQDMPLPPNFATAYPNVTVSRGKVNNYLIAWDKFDFGPRIGIAYQILNKTVIRAGYGVFYGGEENQGGMLNRGYSVPFNETVSMVQSSGISSYVGISDPTCTGCFFMPGGLVGGFPASPFTLNAGVGLIGVETDFRNSLVHKWNFMLQRQLGWDTAIEVGYLGNHQSHSLGFANTDTFANLGTTASGLSQLTQRYIGPACPTCQSVGNGMWMTVSNGMGNYAAGTVKVEKRFSHGLQFLTSYTWSHALADNLTPLSWSNGWGIPDQTNFHSAYSSAAWDIRHSFTTGFNYEVPFGKGKRWGGHMNRAADIIAANWHANGILTLRMASEYTLGGTSCQGVWSRCAPDVVPGYVANQAPAGGRSPDAWFDINAYRVAAPLTGGNLGLNSSAGPPTRTLDFSVFKDFNITERWRLQFRGEAFNLANTPVYSQPDSGLGDAKSLGGNGNFGKILGSVTGTERHMQFALRLTF